MWSKKFGIAALFGIILSCCVGASAQEPQQPSADKAGQTTAAITQTATPPIANLFTTPVEERYRMGPGDVLDIRILNRTNLSRENVRVEGNGTIRMPLIEGEIHAACLTESELAKEVTDRYLKFYRNPQVEVFIKEYHSQQVAVMGAVNDQGRFLLQRRVRLLEILTYAKGVSDKAGETVNVVHAGGTFQCGKNDGRDEVATAFSRYKLSDTLNGDQNANPFLENGDIVHVPRADEVYVVGNVVTPLTIPLKEPITVSRAIAMAGGLKQDTSKGKIRIVRQQPGDATRQEIYVDLSAIEKKRAEDIALLPNDIIDVPASTGKSLIRSLIGGIAPAVTQLPVRVVP
jgi:polysaccharide biosynthesis/export protein